MLATAARVSAAIARSDLTISMIAAVAAVCCWMSSISGFNSGGTASILAGNIGCRVRLESTDLGSVDVFSIWFGWS